ncbi:MAG: hypothetical protein K0Q55_2739 [Verrucomicrobia bacterium]|nr:hypothetical protein [Verrucomicrobiota bacterium]
MRYVGGAALAGILLTQAGSTALQAADATNSIVWHAEANTLDVDIDNKPLSVVVADFKKATGREIHVPPGMSKTVSLKFSGKPMSEGLAKILDGFNYYTEKRETGSRIVVIDPNGATPIPVATRPIAIPRPPTPITPSGQPPGMSGAPSGFTGGRTDGRGGSGGTTGGGDRDRTVRTQEQQVLDALVREAARSTRESGGSLRDRTAPPSPAGGTSSSGKSRSPR